MAIETDPVERLVIPDTRIDVEAFKSACKRLSDCGPTVEQAIKNFIAASNRVKGLQPSTKCGSTEYGK